MGSKIWLFYYQLILRSKQNSVAGRDVLSGNKVPCNYFLLKTKTGLRFRNLCFLACDIMQACQEGADVPFFTVCWYPFALSFQFGLNSFCMWKNLIQFTSVKHRQFFWMILTNFLHAEIRIWYKLTLFYIRSANIRREKYKENDRVTDRWLKLKP